MPGIALRFPVVATCDNCEYSVELPYDVSLAQILASKGRIMPELKEITEDSVGFLAEEGWYLTDDECLCPDCADGRQVSMPMNARALIKEAGQLFRSGKPAALDHDSPEKPE